MILVCDPPTGLQMAVRKASLERTLRVVRCLFSEDGPWHVPPSYILPEETAALRAKNIKACIVKPSGGCRGEGITLAMSGEKAVEVVSAAQALEQVEALKEEAALAAASVEEGSELELQGGAKPSQTKKRAKPCWVVQEYVDRPLLVGHHKCDLRLYVLMAQAAPTVQAWICREGMARVCLEAYEPATEDNAADSLAHLTNISLQHGEAPPLRHPRPGPSKLAASVVISEACESLGADPDAVWAQIVDTVSASLHAIAIEIAGSEPEAGKAEAGSIRRTSFQVIGVDVLLDSTLAPHLLEVNHSPSLALGAPNKPGREDATDEDGDTGEAKAFDAALKIAVVSAALRWGAEGVPPTEHAALSQEEASPHAPRAREWMAIPNEESTGAKILAQACTAYREACGARRLHTGLTKALWEKAAQSLGARFDKAELRRGWDSAAEKGAAAMGFREFLEALVLLAEERQQQLVEQEPQNPAQCIAAWA